MSKALSVVLLAIAITLAHAALEPNAVNTAEQGVHHNSCQPGCRYVCPPSPECPATCRPLCKGPPDCDMECEGLGAATCTVNCMEPRCQVECLDNYQGHTNVDPDCKNVCEEPQCEVRCENPPAKCKPKCPEPYCEWECMKPAACATPKCELKCDTVGSCRSCCSCNDASNVNMAIELAAASHRTGGSSLPHPSLMPSFLEVAHTLTHKELLGEQQCCPCANSERPLIDLNALRKLMK